jgi:hypothetical protein
MILSAHISGPIGECIGARPALESKSGPDLAERAAAQKNNFETHFFNKQP